MKPAAGLRDNEPAIQTPDQPSPLAARAAPPAPGTHRESILVGLLVAATIALYVWWAGPPVLRWTNATPSGYYSELADALLAGQLYLKVQPNPALLRLADPYDPKEFAPYHLIDLTYYRGHYYLYFGVAPAVTLFLPWEALTRTCLADQAGATLFTVAAFVLSVLLLLAVRRRYLSAAPVGAVLLGVVVLALGNLSLLLLRQPNFPQIPIASAWMWQIAALAAVYRALHARRPWPWLALASAACGLAVASRPTFLVGSLLLVPALVRFAGPSRRLPPRSASLAALLPIAAVGVGLMIYNAARFGSPFEFGMRYQLAGGDLRHQVLLSPRYLPANVWSYFFSAPTFTRYFPFIEDQLRPLGVLLVFPFTWLALLAPLGVRAQAGDARAALRAFVASVAVAAIGDLLLLSLYYSNWPRYQLDFFLTLTWLAVLGMLAAAHAWSGRRRRRVLGVTAAALAAVNIGVGFCFAARTYHAPQRLAGLARLAMIPVGWWESVGHTRFGPLHLTVEFPPDHRGRLEPLVHTGTNAGDLVYVRYLDDRRVQLGLFHAGLGFFDGAPVALDRGGPHRLDVDFGSLWPPSDHPLYRGWIPEQILRTRSRLTIALDGRTVLARDFLAHAATPADLTLGRRPADLTLGNSRFSGTITERGRGPATPLVRWYRPAASGGAQLDLQFGPRRVGYSEPLISSGPRGDGDLLFVTYPDPDHIQFGLDGWERGTIRTKPIPLAEADGVHRLAVWMPPLAESAPESTPQKRVTLVWDNRLVWDGTHAFHPATAESLYFGINPIGATSAEPNFSGRLIAVRPIIPEIRSGREVRPPDAPVSLLLQFPTGPIDGGEPLVVTGRPGAGDFVYVRYPAPGQVTLGFDHWAVGGAVSAPQPIDPAAVHRVEISIDSLYAPGPTGGRMPRRVEVRLDGRTVLNTELPCYPAGKGEWYIGENPIGGSTCGARFTGRLLLVERGAAK